MTKPSASAMIRYEFSWPPKELSPNVSVYWRTLSTAKRKYKEACGWAIKAEGIFFSESPVTAQVTFVCDKRRRDPDNHMAMLKPMWDALVMVGVLEDDSHDKLKILAPKWERGPKKVIVELGGRE